MYKVPPRPVPRSAVFPQEHEQQNMGTGGRGPTMEDIGHFFFAISMIPKLCLRLPRFSTFMDIVGLTKISWFSTDKSWKMLVLPTFPTVSMIPETTAPPPKVSRYSMKCLGL